MKRPRQTKTRKQRMTVSDLPEPDRVPMTVEDRIGPTPTGYVRLAGEVLRLKRAVYGDRTPAYVDHLAMEKTFYADDPALCGALPPRTYWGKNMLGGTLCTRCAALANATPAKTIRGPVAATGWD